MADIISNEVLDNIDKLSKDPIIVNMASEVIHGQMKGIPVNMNGTDFMAKATRYYQARGGKIEPLVVGAVTEAIKKARVALFDALPKPEEETNA